jgi:hypothetical protein
VHKEVKRTKSQHGVVRDKSLCPSAGAASFKLQLQSNKSGTGRSEKGPFTDCPTRQHHRSTELSCADHMVDNSIRSQCIIKSGDAMSRDHAASVTGDVHEHAAPGREHAPTVRPMKRWASATGGMIQPRPGELVGVEGAFIEGLLGMASGLVVRDPMLLLCDRVCISSASKTTELGV